ncbi:MAG: DUF1943 domain-containing protein [Providencia heimbachae]|nr:DUF1943 domain-containing protein [Providencia heimbachae]
MINLIVESLVIRAAAETLRQGKSLDFTKLYNREVITIAFPLETGMPFVYSMKTPTLLKMTGEIRARTSPDLAAGSSKTIELPSVVNATGTLKAVYSQMTQATVGFVYTFNHQRYVAGYNKHMQTYLPLSYKIDFDFENAETHLQISPLEKNKDAKLFHISAWPYVAKVDILSLKPISENSHVQLLHVRRDKRFEKIFGQKTTGIAFRAEARTDAKFVDYAWIVQQLQRHDIITGLNFPWATPLLHHCEFNLYYDAEHTTAKHATFTAAFDYEIEGENTSERRHPRSRGDSSEQLSVPSSTSPNSQRRQQELLQKVGNGIQNSRAYVVDLSAQFEGQNKADFVFTAAYGTSPVDKKSRFLFFYNQSPVQAQKYQVCFTAETKMPNVPTLNFREALKYDSTSRLDVSLNFGEKCKSGSEIVLKVRISNT